MKIEQVRKIKSIESEFLKLSKNDKVHLSMISNEHKYNLYSADSESLIVELYIFDDDLGRVKVSIEAVSQSHIENLQLVLEMLQGSV